MQLKNRLIFRNIVFLTVILIIPLIILYTLGYNIDFFNAKIQNSTEVNISTLPFNSKIVVNDNNTFDFNPVNFRINKGQVVDLNISKQDFLDEHFIIQGKANQNTSAKINNLQLLSTTPRYSTKIDTLGNNLILLDKLILNVSDFETKVYPFNYSGIFENPKNVSKINFTNFRAINDDHFENIGINSYYAKNWGYLLWQENGNWNILDLKSQYYINNNQGRFLNETGEIDNIIEVSDSKFLLKDNKNQLWILDLKNFNFKFVESEVYGIYYHSTLEEIWIWHQSNLYRINRSENFELNQNKIFRENLFSYKEILNSPTDNKFKVLKTTKGRAVLYNNNLISINDINTSWVNYIANDIIDVDASEEHLIFLSSAKNLFVYNFILNEFNFLDKLDFRLEDYINLNFNSSLKRIIINGKNFTIQSWYDPLVLNNAIVKHRPSFWRNQVCRFISFDKNLICIAQTNEKRLEIYIQSPI
jgi:hypothetical protein